MELKETSRICGGRVELKGYASGVMLQGLCFRGYASGVMLIVGFVEALTSNLGHGGSLLESSCGGKEASLANSLHCPWPCTVSIS